MKRAAAEARIVELRKQIGYHDERYYVLDEPEISDVKFDRLMEDLQQLESAHPELPVAAAGSMR